MKLTKRHMTSNKDKQKEVVECRELAVIYLPGYRRLVVGQPLNNPNEVLIHIEKEEGGDFLPESATAQVCGPNYGAASDDVDSIIISFS